MVVCLEAYLLPGRYAWRRSRPRDSCPTVAAMTTAAIRSLRVPRPIPVDVVVAAVFCTGAVVELALRVDAGPAGAQWTATFLTTLPLAWRTVCPLPVVIITTVGLALAALMGLDPTEPLVVSLAPILAVYSLGAHSGLWAIGVGGFVALACAVVAGAATGDFSGTAPTAIAVLGALVVGRAVRTLGFETDVLQAQAVELERERDEEARAAVAAERARIARELHDVIGHSISVMGVQAGAVRRRLAPGQERERQALEAVERTGRDAVAEMQRLLGLIRDDDEDSARGALPTLQRVDELAAQLRGAGLDVDLRLEADVGDLPPGRALAAFRVVQEALTNVLKHAPAARVQVTVRRSAGELEIDVVDDGESSARDPWSHGGYGLVAMRERVTMYGGTLDAGPRPEGGFAVSARLPTGAP